MRLGGGKKNKWGVKYFCILCWRIVIRYHLVYPYHLIRLILEGFFFLLIASTNRLLFVQPPHNTGDKTPRLLCVIRYIFNFSRLMAADEDTFFCPSLAYLMVMRCWSSVSVRSWASLLLFHILHRLLNDRIFNRETVVKPSISLIATTHFSCLLKHRCGATWVIIALSRLVLITNDTVYFWKSLLVSAM